MKLWPFGLLLIGLIGVASAAVIYTLTLTGSVMVLAPGLTYTGSLAFGSVAAGSSSSPQTFTLANSGQISFTSIGYTITCNPACTGITLVLKDSAGVDIQGHPLATGVSITGGSAVLSVSSTETAGTFALTLAITGSA